MYTHVDLVTVHRKFYNLDVVETYSPALSLPTRLNDIHLQLVNYLKSYIDFWLNNGTFWHIYGMILS